MQELEQQAVLESDKSTDLQKQIAEERLKILGLLKGQAEAEAAAEYASPGERYLEELNREAANINDRMEDLAVEKMKEFADYAGDATAEVLGLDGALGDLVSSIIKMGIEMALLRPLAQALWGGGGIGAGGGGGLGGFLGTLGSIIGIGGGGGTQGFIGPPMAGGGAVKAGVTYPVGEEGAELFKPDTSGTIIPNHIARGMSGQGPARVTLLIGEGEMFSARVASISGEVAVETVKQSTPAITEMAAARTVSQMGRRRM